MTGPEHYRRAEELLERAARPFADVSAEEVDRMLAEAQVHATLALAAATAMAGVADDEGGRTALPSADERRWRRVAGESTSGRWSGTRYPGGQANSSYRRPVTRRTW